MQLTCRAVDVALFEAEGFVQQGTSSEWPGTVEMFDEQRNYADTDELPRVPFFGSHGAGGCYGCGVFACDGTELVTCETLHDSGYPAARITKEGNVKRGDIDEALRYYKVLLAAETALKNL